MELTLVKLKSDFNNIITIRNNVKNVFDILQVRIDKLRQIYSEFIKNNKNEMFIFGLDSFRFQSKLIDIEYDDMVRLFLAINNRMYCEYFKLHKLIVDYILKITSDKKVSEVIKMNSYPPYKDLEPFKEYKFELVLDIHENILNLLSIIISILNNKENELVIHKTKQNIGLNIDNFITGFNFNINVMREKIMMFITYIEFFHKMHSKYLKRFNNKIQLMYTNINNDIKFDENIEMTKDKISIQKSTSNNEINSLKYLDNNIELTNDTPLSSRSLANSSSDSNHSYISQVSQNNQTNKSDLKKIFKTNVNKVTSMLQIFKPKMEKTTNQPFLDKEVDEMFSSINKSCDSIINEDNINQKLIYQDKIDEQIDEQIDEDVDDIKKIKTTSLSSDILLLNEENLINNSINNTILNNQPDDSLNQIIDIEINPNVEPLIDILKNNSELDEINSLTSHYISDNSNITDNSYKEHSDKELENSNESVFDNNNSTNQVIEDIPKKKRTYNRKKKTTQ
jgi:hypothetical protein